MDNIAAEIAAAAARIVVEEGLEYGPAKRRAAKQLALGGRGHLPDNEMVEDAVREHIAIFCADTQPAELRALRELALMWMVRMAEFRPYVGGAVWHGTATRLSDVYIQMFCDDCKSAEISLIDHRIDYDPQTVTGFHGESVEALTVAGRSPDLEVTVGVHLMVYDLDDLRGALRPDGRGRPPRGDITALRALLSAS